MRDVPPTASEDPDDWPRGSLAPLDADALNRHPQQIGSYTILGVLGRGGMGVVYRAEQSHPRRTVALKVLPLGLLYSDRLVRRFDHEAEVLGRLRHPGIAQIYEAGTADGGFGLQPFFAMEFVDGVPLTQHAADRSLLPRQRLELLARTCDAVHYAHQQGVVHRDLKPANILVEASGEPKVVDFGVARAAEVDAKWTLAETEAGTLLGTLPYMSPEQAAGDVEQIDTRTDVYALGVIAYELLAGRLPLQLAGVPLADAVGFIRDREPPRLGTVDRIYRGDVETIVCKAMQKEKQRRYDSAAELAADLRRHLNDEPITARPPTTWYQLKKFARRNKSFVSAVVAVFLATVTGAGVALWQKRQAELQLAKAGQLSDVLTELFMPDEQGVNAALLERLEKVSAPSEPLPLANVCRVLASGWHDSGSPEKSVPYWRRTLDLRQRHLGEDKAATVDAAIGLAEALVVLDRAAEAEHPILRASHCARLAMGETDPATLRAQVCLINVWDRLGRADQADRFFERAILAPVRAAQAHDPDTIAVLEEPASRLFASGRPAAAARLFAGIANLYRGRAAGRPNADLAIALSNFGTALLEAQDPRATVALREATEACGSAMGTTAEETLRAKRSLAVALINSDLGDAQLTARQVLKQYESAPWFQAGDADHLHAIHTLAQCELRPLTESSPQAQVEDVCRLYERLLESNGGQHRPGDPEVVADVAWLTSRINDHQSACSLLRAALKRYEGQVNSETIKELEQRLAERERLINPPQ